jgi:Xaa-Pro aminopeptidase
MDFHRRRELLTRKLRDQDLDAMLITKFVNVTYLTGFTGDDSYLLLTRDKAVLLSDSRYAEQLGEECSGLELEIRRTPTTMTESLAGVCQSCRVGTVAVEGESMTLAHRDRLAQAMPKISWKPVAAWVEDLRAIKDEDEVAEIRRSIALAEEVFAELKANLRGDQSERGLAADLEHRIRHRGGRGCAFSPIVAAGPRAALPHAQVTDATVAGHPLLLVDWGAKAGLYCSDLTRVLALDRISPRLQEVYEVVLEAQLRAISAVRAGVLMSDVDAAARGYIAEAGHGDHFGHGLGHGFGLEIHENPRLTPSENRPLEAGMVITIEPGVYLPGWGGVRIEDDVLVTANGCEVLTSATKELSDCVAPLA